MRYINLLKLAIIIISLSWIAGAEIGLEISIYNSNDALSIGLEGEDLNFDAGATLMPDSLFYSNGGSSNSPDAHYSYGTTFNGQTLESGAKTDSGKFSWNTLADSNSNGDGSKDFKLSFANRVQNGALESYYSNPDHAVKQTSTTKNAVYSQMGLIRQESIKSSGVGFTQQDSGEETNTESNNIKGTQGSISVTGPEKASLIEENVIGDTDARWADFFKSDQTGCNLFRGITGIIRGSDRSLEMIGEATGFPTQILPPGNVKISSKLYDPQKDGTFEYFIEEIDKFRNEYPDSQLSPSLWYYLDQKAFFGIIGEGDNPKQTIQPGEFYKMSMQFSLKR